MKPKISITFEEFAPVAPVKIKPMPFAVRLNDAKSKRNKLKSKAKK